MSLLCRVASCLVLVLAFVHASTASAQPGGPDQHGETFGERADDTELLLILNGGMVVNGGNTRSFAANLGARLSLKRMPHLFSAETRISFGTASLRDPMTGEFGDWEPIARNIIGGIRYDFFLTDMDALFAAMRARNDTFAGLDLRLQNQIGYMRNFFLFNEGKHRLWGEIGYDLTFDNYHPDPLLDMMGNVLDGDEVIHSVRAFLGYDNHIRESIAFITGFEFLFDVQDPGNIRFASESQLLSKVSDVFQIGVGFTVLYDNEPVPGNDTIDTITSINMTVSLDLERAEPEEEAPPACPPCPEAVPCPEPPPCPEASPPAPEPVPEPVPEPDTGP